MSSTKVSSSAAPAVSRASRAKTVATTVDSPRARPEPTVMTTDAPVASVAPKTRGAGSKKSPKAMSPVAVGPIVTATVESTVVKASPAKEGKKAGASRSTAVPKVSVPSSEPKAAKAPKAAASASAVKPAPKVASAPKVPKVKPASADGVTSTKRVSATPPMSPRTASSRLVTKGGDVLSYRDVRATADAVSRSVHRLAQIATAVGRKGSLEANGRTYTSADVREMSKALSQAVRRLPVVCRLSSRRGVSALPEEERLERVAALLERSYAGIDELTSSISLPKMKAIMRSNEKTRIEGLRVPSKPDAGVQISAAFYISDPLREFIRNANLGNGIALFFPEVSDEARTVSGATDPDGALKAVQDELPGRNVLAELGLTKEQARQVADPRHVIKPLIIERGIATSPLLMSIMACYIAANGLKGPDGRIAVDDNMRRHFGSGTTRWVLGGKDFTPAEALEDVSLSGLERLKRRGPKNPGDPLPFDGSTFTRSMSIALASMYRIAKVSDEQLQTALTNTRIVNLANGVKSYL